MGTSEEQIEESKKAVAHLDVIIGNPNRLTLIQTISRVNRVYPLVTIDDVYKEVLELVENFKKYAR